MKNIFQIHCVVKISIEALYKKYGRKLRYAVIRTNPDKEYSAPVGYICPLDKEVFANQIYSIYGKSGTLAAVQGLYGSVTKVTPKYVEAKFLQGKGNEIRLTHEEAQIGLWVMA